MILVIQLLVAAAFGGLGGAVFTWWTNRRFRLPPVLSLALVLEEGEKQIIQRPNGNREDARYYHLRVSNDRRWSPATDVQVFLIRMEELGPDGSGEITWVGEIPMRWRNQEQFPLMRTIGHAADCDLCCLGENRWLELEPLFVPHSLVVHRTGQCRLAMTMQVRSTQADSPLFRVEVYWDGEWENGDAEIKRRLRIKVSS